MAKKDDYILLGLDRKEVNILSLKVVGNTIKVEVEKKSKKERCPYCNQFTSSIHDRLKPINSVYLSSCEQKIDLLIYKKRYRCHKCEKTFTEKLSLNTENGSISNKVKIKIRKDLLDYTQTIKSIAEKNRVSEYIVKKELEEVALIIPDYVTNLPRIISFDEFKADTKEGKYAFILNDPIHKKILDILPNRKKEYLIQYFTHVENRHSVEFVISDMYEPYLLVTTIMFPKAKYVVDRFHYIRYIMDALDKIRIRLQKSYGESSKQYKMLKNKKNVSLLRKYGNDINWWVVTRRYRNGHMVDVLPGELIEELRNISPDLRKGYWLKEEFLDIIKHASYEDAERQLTIWISKCIESNIKEFKEAAGTVSRWKKYIVNSFIDERFSNGYTEGTNNKIKVIKRVAFGYKNFKLLRSRILYIFNKKLGGSSNGRKNNK